MKKTSYSEASSKRMIECPFCSTTFQGVTCPSCGVGFPQGTPAKGKDSSKQLKPGWYVDRDGRKKPKQMLDDMERVRFAKNYPYKS